MNKVRQSAPHLANIEPYDPKYIPAKIMNSANENPLDVPAHIKREMMDAAERVQFNRYPDPLANNLRDMIAEGENELLEQMFDKNSVVGNCLSDKSPHPHPFHFTRDNVLVGNGGDELLFNLALTWGGVGRTLLNTPPTFSVYANNAYLTGTNIANIPRREDFSLDEPAILESAVKDNVDYIILTSPNNPTGDLVRPEFVEQLLNTTDALVMMDEAYFEFSQQTVLPLLAHHKNLIILRTFSKAFSLAGVRVGYVLAHAEVIREFFRVRQPYSVDALSQEIAKVAYSHRAEFYESARTITQERERMFDELRKLGRELRELGHISCELQQLGRETNRELCDSQQQERKLDNTDEATQHLEVFPSHANYLLVRLLNADIIWQQLFDAGILVRDFSHTKGLENCLRISIGTREENDALLHELENILKSEVN